MTEMDCFLIDILLSGACRKYLKKQDDVQEL
ncbi:hypothetical protein SAMN05428961_104670 [Paenibacillus sp. OK060]|nr:hypothetical protein SAMN05428961_104670 [Paenibacillus sp. OK060]